MSTGGALRQIFAMFDVDTGGAEAKLDKLDKKTTSVKDMLGTLAATAFGAFSLHGIESFIEENIELGSQLNDLSERLGVSTDDLQRFQFAAGLAGVGAEESAKGLQFLNKSIGDALGGQKESVQQFAEMGIAIKDADGGVRELGDVIPEVADAFEKMGSDQERTVKAMQLFGKSGAALLPLLKSGSSELRKLNEEFDDLGLGIDEDFIRKADEAGDRIDILKLGFRALKTRVAAELLPGITEAAKKFSQWVKIGRDLTKETYIVKEAIGGIGIAAALAAGKTVAGWSKVLGLFPKGGEGGLFESLLGMGKLGLILGAMLLVGGAIESVVVMCKGGQSVIGDFFDSMGMASEKQQLIESLTKAWADMQPALAELGPLVGQVGVAFAKVLPYVIGLVTDAIKVVLTFGNAIAGVVLSVAKLVKGDSEGAGNTVLRTQGTIDDLWKGGSTFGAMLNAGNTATASDFAPGARLSEGPGTVNMNPSTVINVNGAGNPGDVAQRVAVAQNGINQQTLNDAASAVFSGAP